MKPLCFVLMPLGIKRDENGKVINFDRIYLDIIKPAVEAADLESIRADEELIGGIIHKPMFERLMLCDYAIADLTSANANVFYELGIRHGVRPYTTVLVFARGMRLPFDVSPLRGLPYQLDSFGLPAKPAEDKEALVRRLLDCRNPVEDSPLFQLVTEWPRPDLARLKTDRFREVVDYCRKYKAKLEEARGKGLKEINEVAAGLNIADTDPAIIVDLFLSYRAVEAWAEMVGLVSKMSPILARTVLVQEQLGFALNRLGARTKAEGVLTGLIKESGASSETNGILGRVYKDLWQDALASGQRELAAGFLRKAIDCYVDGFEADWRDAYPGLNAVSLMESEYLKDHRQAELIPVVQYSVSRRLESKSPDYWDYASQLELAVLSNDEKLASQYLSAALASIREKWEPKTTANNLRIIREGRAARGIDAAWLLKLEEPLIAAAKPKSS